MLASITWLCLNFASVAIQDAPLQYQAYAVADLAQVIFKPTHAPVTEGIRIAWDHSTLTRVSHDRFRSAGYSRMIQLRDGALICIYEADGSTFITRSDDSGETWGDPIPVAWKQDGINMAAPDIIELNDGSLLAMYNPRPWKINPRRTFGIRTRKSYDGGRTWIHGRLIHEASHIFDDGAWEPAAVQMPDGEIRVFFADEGAYRESGEQNISMLRSRDGGLTWTDTPEIVSFRPHGRDGMPAPLLLQNDDLVIAIEDTRPAGKMKPVIIRTKISEETTTAVGPTDPNRWLALAEPQRLDTYAGAPYLRQLSTGETILSFHSSQGRRNNALHSADMKVAIGNEQAQEFTRLSQPFDIPKNRWGLWNSVTILDDKTVAAITSTNAFGFLRSEVWMIKGRIIPELSAPRQSLVIDGYPDEGLWSEQKPPPVFIGRNSHTSLHAGAACDDQNLYFFSRVTDPDIATESSTIENNDGITVSVTSTTLKNNTPGFFAPTNPAPGVYQVNLSADNHLVIKQGTTSGHWREVTNSETAKIRHKSRITPEGYIQEIAIPRSLVSTPANVPSSTRTSSIAVNFSLTDNTGSNIPDYRESVSSTHEDNPSTWLPLLMEDTPNAASRD